MADSEIPSPALIPPPQFRPGNFRPRQFLFNSDFDITLSGQPSMLEGPDLNFVHEMAWHFLFAPLPGDSLLLPLPLPQEFLQYIQSLEIHLPTLVPYSQFISDQEFTPFGWNEFAEKHLGHYQTSTAHPDLASVKQANARSFSRGLEKKWASESLKSLENSEAVEGSQRNEKQQALEGNAFSSLEDLKNFIAEFPRAQGWMAKGEHGHAGIGNRRISGNSVIGETDAHNLIQLFSQHGKIILEPWHERIMDLSANFKVNENGEVVDFFGHELFNSRDGSFLGIKVYPDRQAPEPWRDSLLDTAKKLGKELKQIGYFGPVSMDAYIWDNADEAQLRPLVDVNARLSMAMPIHGLAQRIPGKFIFWTWMKPKKLSLPTDYGDLQKKLGTSAYNPKTQTGIAVVSPVWKENGALAKRIGFMFSAEDEDQLKMLQETFAKTFRKKSE